VKALRRTGISLKEARKHQRGYTTHKTSQRYYEKMCYKEPPWERTRPLVRFAAPFAINTLAYSNIELRIHEHTELGDNNSIKTAGKGRTNLAQKCS
jgi:hypothetical protein